MLGATVVDHLWHPGYKAIGEIVRIQAVPFQVIGVLARKGQSPMRQDYDDTILTPYTTFRTKISAGLGGFINGVIFVSATDRIRRSAPSARSRCSCAIAITSSRMPTMTSRYATSPRSQPHSSKGPRS